MRIMDISMTIRSDMVSYPEDPQPKFSPWDVPNEENSFRSTWIELLSHTGTHVDAPIHLFPNGIGIDQLQLNCLIGDAIVVDVTNKEKMSVNYFKTHKDTLKDKIVLLKTGEGNYLEKGVFRKNYLAPDRTLANFLVDQGIKAIGIDALSIDRSDIFEIEAHPVFLEANIPIIEGLYLEEVNPGSYFCICLPLKIKELDGAPARAVLIEF